MHNNFDSLYKYAKHFTKSKRIFFKCSVKQHFFTYNTMILVILLSQKGFLHETAYFACNHWSCQRYC